MKDQAAKGRGDVDTVDVIAGILEQGGRYLVGRRPPGGSLPNLWEFPGGKVEPGETPEEALEREFLEELGVHVDVGEAVGVSFDENPQGRIRLAGYRVFYRAGRFELRAHQELRWLTVAQLREIPLAPADIPLARALGAEIQ